MHIKEVNITGFRSYKETTTVRNFSKKHNVVVGRNGSGKSNFFTAIQFVLSSEFSSLSQQDRHALLHEGLGSRSQLAKVEIVFDNSDHRIPTDNDEVRITRQVAAKKDQYFIDNKQVTRTEIVNLMESAGFSRSNPYYIVKQGKITELATASDAYRLKLIKEVAGTRVFDEKKEESTKILQETQGKIEKSVTLLGYINERLKKLEEEKEDLKEYQKWDKMRRAIEYTIYEMEISEAKIKLEKLTLHREKINKQQNELETRLINEKMEIQEIEKDLRQLNTHYKGVNEERETLMKEQSELLERKTQLELTIKDLSEDVNKERSGRENAEVEMQKLEKAITEKETELRQWQPKYNKLVEDESRLNSDIRIIDQRCKELYSRQGHQEQFKTMAERDKHLQHEISWIDRQIYETQKQIDEIQESIQHDKDEHDALRTRYQDEKSLLEEKSINMDRLNQEMKKKKEELNRALTERIEYSRFEKEKREQFTMIQYDITRMEEELRRLTSKAIMNGVASVKTVLEEFHHKRINHDVISGYYGRVIDLFNCEFQFNKAIEVTAEARLFYHVVEDDVVAMKILERINQRSLPGEMNFYPLNRMLTAEKRTVQDPDASPILDHMEFDPKFEKIFLILFKDHVFVKDVAAGTRISKNENFNCVTLEGDQISRRGPMTGGYMDVKKSKVDLIRKLKIAQTEQTKIEADMEQLGEKIAQSLALIDQIRMEINRLEIEIQTLSREHHICLEKKRVTAELLNRLSTNAEPKKAQIAKLQHRIREYKAHKEMVNAQIGSALQSQMSNQEIEQIDVMEDEIRQKKNELEKLCKERADVENRIQTINNELQHKLLKKRENLNAKIESIAVGEMRNRLDTEQAEIKLVNERLLHVIERLRKLDDDLNEYETKKGDLSGRLESHQEEQKLLNENLEESAKDAEIYCTKIATIQTKREECSRKIKEIGSLPSDAHGTYNQMSLKQLDKKLIECMNELKKYENVNKKACEQFLRASSQKEELSKRVEELQKNEQSIKDLLIVLENRRYETLHLTFKQVAKNFSEVFKALIPEGQANLVMQTLEKGGVNSRSTDFSSRTNAYSSTTGVDTSKSSDQQTEEPQKEVHELETFVGTSIKVSFTGTGETRDITSLSGGQKTLVALALIFAIQRCDPAPFYLFDEIDAALDQEHRRSVALMIHNLSNNAQFITTTFRAELLENAEKFYGVRVRDKVSYIDEITKAMAVDFIQDDQTHS